MQKITTDTDGYPEIPGFTRLPPCFDTEFLLEALAENHDRNPLREDRLEHFVNDELAGLLGRVRLESLVVQGSDEYPQLWHSINARGKKHSFKLAVSQKESPPKAALYIKGDSIPKDAATDSDRRNAGLSICHFLGTEIIYWATGRG